MTTPRSRARAQVSRKEPEVTIEQTEAVVQRRKAEVSENSSTGLMVTVPITMKVALEKYAKDNDTTVGAFGRKVLADAIGFDLSGIPVREKKSKATKDPEIAKAEARARGKEQRAMLKAMLARVRAAEGIEVDEEDDEDDDEDEA